MTADRARAAAVVALVVLAGVTGAVAFTGGAAAASASVASASVSPTTTQASTTDTVTVRTTMRNVDTSDGSAASATFDFDGLDLSGATVTQVIASSTGADYNTTVPTSTTTAHSVTVSWTNAVNNGTAGDTVLVSATVSGVAMPASGGDYAVRLDAHPDGASALSGTLGSVSVREASSDVASANVTPQSAEPAASHTVTASATVSNVSTASGTAGYANFSFGDVDVGAGSVTLVRAASTGTDYNTTVPTYTSGRHWVNVTWTNAPNNGSSLDTLLVSATVNGARMPATSGRESVHLTANFDGTNTLAGYPLGDVAVSYGPNAKRPVVYRGQTVTFAGFTGTTVSLRRKTDGGSTFVSQYRVDGGTVSLDTSDLAAADYYLEGRNGARVDFEVTDHTMSVRANATRVQRGDPATLHLSTNRVQPFAVNVTADGLTQDELASLFDPSGLSGRRVNGDAYRLSGIRGDTPVDVSADVPIGNYTLGFVSTDTPANASVELNVTRQGLADASFDAGSYEVARGGIANVTVDFHRAEYATLTIGRAGDANYQQNVTVHDGDGNGRASVQFNTYAAGHGNDAAVSADSGTITDASSTRLNGLLDRASYQLAVAGGRDASYAGVANATAADTLGALSVTDRSTGSATTWVAPHSGVTLGSASDVESAIRSGDVTRSSTVALTENGGSDRVVVAVNATGVAGALASGDTLAGVPDVGFSVNRTTAVMNGPPKTLSLADASLYEDATNDTTFVVFEPGKGYADGSSVDAGERLRANLTVGGALADPTENASTAFRLVDAGGTIAGGGLGAAAGTHVRGTTNVAPGTELTVRLRSQNRILTNTTTAAPGGTFDATLDAASLPVGANYTVSLKRLGKTYDTASGVVVAQQSANVTTATGKTASGGGNATTSSESASTPASGTSTSTGTGTSTGTSTAGGAPGFGAGVAALALAGAALLALRRGR